MIIYKATNKIDGKCYIGQSAFSLEKRKGEHLKGSRTTRPRYYIHRAINKYGMDNFTWEVLYECDTQKELDQAELDFIEQYKSLAPNGYNCVMIASGGDTLSMHPKREQIRKRISEGTLKGIAKSDKSWSHFGKENSMYGRKHSPESIAKMRKNRRGKCLGDDNPMRKPGVAKKQHLSDDRNFSYRVPKKIARHKPCYLSFDQSKAKS